MSALVPGTLVLSPLGWCGRVVEHFPAIGATRVLWSALDLTGVSPTTELQSLSSAPVLATLARWHRGRAAQVKARRLATATTVPRDVLAEMVAKMRAGWGQRETDGVA